jgi:hypothetical protein
MITALVTIALLWIATLIFHRFVERPILIRIAGIGRGKQSVASE